MGAGEVNCRHQPFQGCVLRSSFPRHETGGVSSIRSMAVRHASEKIRTHCSVALSSQRQASKKRSRHAGISGTWGGSWILYWSRRENVIMLLTREIDRSKSVLLHPEQQDPTTVTLPVVPTVGPLCTTAEDGKRLHRMIQALLNEGYSVSLDFTGVRFVTKTFYDAVLGDLAFRYPGVRVTSVNLPAETSFC
jgi:uncharacterized protein DUF4325